MHGMHTKALTFARSVLPALAFTSLGAPALSAQSVTVAANESEQRAAALHENAARLFESPARYREAARMLQQAASMRLATDDRATRELLLAGRLSYYASDWSTARRMFEQGSERALSSGQITLAANALVDAAFSALEQKDADDALGYVARAERLAGSPHLEAPEREEILSRIRPVRVALGDTAR